MDGITQGIQYSLDRSVDDLNTSDSDDLWKACSLLPEAGRLSLLQKLNSPMLLAMGEIRDPRVRLIASFSTLSDHQLKLYWLQNSLSRAYFVAGVERASSRREALERLLQAEFPFGSTVILEEPRIVNRMGVSGAGVAKTLEYQNRRVRCAVTAKMPGFMVLLDSYYPGWHAYLDGREVQILRANYAFRAVEIPAGTHEVEFRYRPQSFSIGLALTCLALVLGVVSLFWKRIRT